MCLSKISEQVSSKQITKDNIFLVGIVLFVKGFTFQDVGLLNYRFFLEEDATWSTQL